MAKFIEKIKNFLNKPICRAKVKEPRRQQEEPKAEEKSNTEKEPEK